MTDDVHLTTEEVVDYLAKRNIEIKASTLATWRSRGHGQGPAFHRFGGKVSYKQKDVDQWIEDSRVDRIVKAKGETE